MMHWKLATTALWLMSTFLPTAQVPEDARAEATYVFLGTVAESEQTTVGAVKGLAVTVEETIFKKGVFDDQTGRTVIVAQAPSSLQPGQRYVFYTDPILFGQTIVVRLIATRVPTGEETISRMRQESRDAHHRLEIRKRVDLAEVVLLGRVTAVRPLTDPAPRDSEHLPDFRVARVEVEQVLKGDVTTETIEFVFAASQDVQWYRTPKFQIGNNGIFLLNAAAAEYADTLVRVRVRFSLLHELDFQPRENLALVQSVLQ